MPRFGAIFSAAFFAGTAALAQDSSSKPPVPGTSSSSATTTPVVTTIPTVHDTQRPDPSAAVGPPDKHKNKLRRALDRAAPNCAQIFFVGMCWSEPPGPEPSKLPEEEQKYRHEIEVGQYNLDEKAYKGAVMRFEAALGYKPEDPVATYKRALSLDRNKQVDEARIGYQRYIEIAPEGSFAMQARAALDRMDRAKAKTGKPAANQAGVPR